MIERLDTIQTETRANGAIFKSKILWKNDCSFDLYVNSLQEPKLTGNDSILASIPITVEIKYIGLRYYICESVMKRPGVSFELRDTIYFIK